MNQFTENMGVLSNHDMEVIKKLKILLVGLGGLGGHVANCLVRLGFEKIILVDYDHFELSNLNRQLFSSHENIGKSKTEIIKSELLKIHPGVNIITYPYPIEEISNVMVNDFDYIIDAVDCVKTKIYLEELAHSLNIPLLHGAIGGWYGQVGIILPGANLLAQLYDTKEKGLEKSLKSPTFTPGIIAHMMVCELIKYITNKNALINQIMSIDLYNNEQHILFK